MNFSFATAGRVVFGAGSAATLPQLVPSMGTSALVCTGSQPDRHSDLIGALGVPVTVCPVRGEPDVAAVRAATERARASGVDVVVAIGGGSVIDLAKAVAILLGNDSDPMDHLEVVGLGKPITRPAVPFVAVPTTAGAGAEVTANAVLAVPERRLKVSLRSHLMLPAVALIDPELTLATPRSVTAASGLDALTQCLEPLVSPMANPITDALATEGLAAAASGLRAAYADGSDLLARTDMCRCALMGGMALANAKLGAVHGLAGVLGGTTGAAHGAICAALLAPVIEANVAALRERLPDSPALDRYQLAARLLTGEPSATVDDGVGWIRRTVAELGIGGLAELGFAESDAEAVVAKAVGASSMQGNPVRLTTAELHAVLAAAR